MVERRAVQARPFAVVIDEILLHPTPTAQLKLRAIVPPRGPVRDQPVGVGLAGSGGGWRLLAIAGSP